MDIAIVTICGIFIGITLVVAIEYYRRHLWKL